MTIGAWGIFTSLLDGLGFFFTSNARSSPSAVMPHTSALWALAGQLLETQANVLPIRHNMVINKLRFISYQFLVNVICLAAKVEKMMLMAKEMNEIITHRSHINLT